jgi:peroxiredoxin
MKHLLKIAVFSIVFYGCGGGKKTEGAFELKGTLKDSKGEMIYLERFSNRGAEKVDSAEIDETGNFSMENYVPKIGFYRIKINDQNFAMLVLDSMDKVKITGSAKDLGNTYKVEGSPETVLFMAYNEIGRRQKTRDDSLQQAFRQAMYNVKMDSLKMDSLSKVFEPIYNAMLEQFNEEMISKIKQNTTMFASIIALQNLDPDKNIELFKALDEGLQKKYPRNENVKTFHTVVQRTLSSKSGAEAPEINLPDTNGKPLALSSFRGKVVLIDFWASWCRPCRAEMPNVVAAYAKYKSKGFEIYGVSLDRDKGAWLEAIAKDGITWPQVSDLKYWDCEAAKLYNVQGIPFTVLLDKDGKIIAKNLRGAELEEKLKQVLN